MTDRTPTPLAQQGPGQRRLRVVKDRLASVFVGAGGVMVVVALMSIFAYLLVEVLPLFRGASIAPRIEFAAPGGGDALYVALDEQTEVGARFLRDGRVVFFATNDGRILLDQPLLGLGAASITSATIVNEAQHSLAFGLSDGRVIVVRHEYDETFPDDKRVVVPRLEYPLGEEPLVADEQKQEVKALALQYSNDSVLMAFTNASGVSQLVRYAVETSFIDEDAKSLTREANVAIPQRFDHGPRADFMAIDPQQSWLFMAAADGELMFIDVRDPASPTLLTRRGLARDGESLTSLGLLGGGISLIAGYSSGRVDQLFPVRDAENRYSLERVRGFRPTGAAIAALGMEQRRKGFVGVDESGRLSVYHTTSQRVLLDEQVIEGAARAVSVAPRANAVLLEDAAGRIHLWDLHNEHPEVSWQALWGKVWYESYPGPEYVWQSSAATRDFEPKLSLAPLSFGSLKAAFYAMLVAIPLALMGAIYTAYFMTPALRQVVKPAIEVMAALPSVILGFLAGLWLAPFLEAYLLGVFLFILALPIGIVGFGWCWDRFSGAFGRLFPEGALGALLVPVILLIGALAFGLSKPLELAVFGGNLPHYLSNVVGIDYDQRNALVVGVAMGFAVIPIIFSIAEDAIFGVPSHLSNGSLALGATPWQTLVRVVLPTASPGIFSAVMIGLGRAVGETMIVLMATGNTPIMDVNIFEGMRTLAANIAVEMPESEVGSTHYRVLCLAAMVLFLFTFVLNTAAEIVRQRLREKYSNL
jgi:phosphate transport system permease protein